jgi:PIN domain nuclease of toxin-antitoxin system
MELISYLDTNTVIWLHAGELHRITNKAQQQIEACRLLISAMVLLELEMLFEKGVIKYKSEDIYADLHQAIGITVCQFPMSAIMRSAISIKWTREPGDRIIAANAMANNQAPLITSDRTIREFYANAIW